MQENKKKLVSTEQTLWRIAFLAFLCVLFPVMVVIGAFQFVASGLFFWASRFLTWLLDHCGEDV